MDPMGIGVPIPWWIIDRIDFPDIRAEGYPSHDLARHCSLIDGVDLFDNKLFGLSLAETKGPVPSSRQSLGVPRQHLWLRDSMSLGVYLIFRDINIWICNELYIEQGSPHPPCSQMVPSPPCGLGGFPTTTVLHGQCLCSSKWSMSTL